MNLTEPTYIGIREFGRKIQQAFAQSECVGIYEDWTTTDNHVEITHRAVFDLPDKSCYVYYAEDNDLWYYPVSGDPIWYIVNHPYYAPSDTL